MTNNSTFNLTGGTISGGLIHWRNSALNSLASATTSTVSSDLMIRPDFATPTLTINVADGTAETDLLVNGRIQQSTPSGNLVKTGAGTLKLSNNCSYTGTTTVSGGTLATDWYLASDDVTVADGATLAGNGGIGGNVTIQTGGHHALAVAAAAFQQVTRQIEGLLTLETGTFLDLSAAVPPAEGTYVLLTATGGITGTLPTVTGLSGNLTINGNNLEFTVTATPFSAWAQSRITDIDPVADATPTGDPDADGVNNLAEFAFNGDPLNGADNGYRLGQPTNVPSIGNALILTFATRAGADFGTGPTATADGVSYTVQGSLDLDAFTSPVTKVTPAIVPPGWPAVGDYEYHTFRLDASTGLAGKGFLRVKTEQ
jgi:autotransporter-associated beta strand protein